MTLRSAIVVPARYSSTRFPGKALAPLAGRPLILWVLERAALVPGVSEVMAATDDERIAQVVRDAGARVVLTSDKHRNGTERVAEVAARLDVDLVVNVQGDEPLIEPAHIQTALSALETDDSVLMSTLATRLHSAEVNDPNVVKVVCDRRGRALYFSRSAIPHVSGAPDLPLQRHLGVYGFRREFLIQLASLEQTPLERCESLEQLRALEHGYSIQVAQVEHSAAAVDTPDQLAALAARLEDGS